MSVRLAIPLVGATLSDSSLLTLLRGDTQISLKLIHDAYVKLMLQCDGANGDIVIPDSSSYSPKIGQPIGTTQITTGDYKYGTGSLLFASGDYLKYANHADWNLGAGDFTFEFFMKTTSAATQRVLARAASSTFSSGRWNLGTASGKMTLGVHAINTSSNIITGTTTINDNVWHHIAWVRYGNTWTIFTDGATDGTPVTSSAAIPDNTDPLTIAIWIGAQGFIGGIDGFRFSKGVARYTAPFTAPTSILDYSTATPTATPATVDSGMPGTVWDMSSIANAANLGGEAGSIKYKYAYGDANDPTNWSGAWQTLSALQAEADPTARYFRLDTQFTSNGLQNASLQDLSIVATLPSGGGLSPSNKLHTIGAF